jgi:UDP-N-acetylmuramate dehydrogenase
MAYPNSCEQMVALMEIAAECNAKPFVIGKGTNLLVADEGLDRLVIDTSEMNRMELGEEPFVLMADAGVSLARLADFACKQGMAGLEFAHGIPGTVGGAVCMNAGAYDGEMKLVIEQVMVYFPGEGVREIAGVDMDFSYRHSLLSDRPEAVVLSAVFRLKAGDPEVIRERMRELMARRKASQPLEFPSAGSTFKRPTGYFAGTLIDQNGLKGLTVGGAQVSEKHAGFVINVGNATFKDVTGLIEAVQERIFAATGVHLEPEVKIIRS